MTKNQIEYQRVLELERSNRANEELKSKELELNEITNSIKDYEAKIKERAQQLDEAMFDYDRLGTGIVGGIGRLITAYGKDTGIDSVIKQEASEAWQHRIGILQGVKQAVTNVKEAIGRILKFNKN